MRTFFRRHAQDFFYCLLFLLGGGVLSWLNGQDATWDLLNYHLYNPFAFLTGRLSTDIMPAGIHTFLNPILDVPLYWMIQHFNTHPQLIAFVQGLWGGALGFVVYQICRLIFEREKPSALLACAIGITGSMSVSQIGLSYNEVPLAFFMCCALYLLLLFLLKYPTKISLAFATAFLAGAAGGLKYTAAPFVIGMAVAFFSNIRSFSKPLRTCVWFALGGLSGFLITNGFFMLHFYQTYGNPLFPFFNSIFQSPYFDPVNFEEIRFYPRSIWQWLFYPFFWIFPNSWLVSEPTVADARLALAQISFLTLLPGVLFKSIQTSFSKKLLRTILVFCAVSFILWMRFYSVLRYLVPLEALSGVLVLLALRQFFSRKITTSIVVILLLLLGMGTHYPNWGREMFSAHAIELTPLPRVEKNALVLLVGQPLSFVAPFFPSDSRFIGGIKLPISQFPKKYWTAATARYPLTKLYYAYHFEQAVQQVINEHTGPIYLVTIPWDLMLSPLFLTPLGLQASSEPCQKFNANINQYTPRYVLCKLEKLLKEKTL